MADEPIPISGPTDRSGESGDTPDDENRRAVSRLRGTKRPRVETGSGSTGGQVTEGSVPSRATEGMTPGQVWGHIWHQFSERRSRDRNGAHMGLITSIADNAENLSGLFQNPKDFVDTIIHLEGFVKEASGAKEGAAIDYVSNFLNRGEITVAPKKAN